MSTRPDLRILSLSSTNRDKNPTWNLRVGMMLPGLRARGWEIDTVQVPRSSGHKLTMLGNLRGYDIAWIHRCLFWPAELEALRPAARHLVLDLDDPVHLSSSTWGNFSLRRCFKFRRTARRCSAVIVASDGLEEMVRRHNERVIRIPLCCRPEAYAGKPNPRRPGEPLRLLWLGGRSTFKYLYAIRPQLETIGQNLGSVELVVVGHEDLHLKNLKVHNLRWSPAVEEETLRRVHVGLAPMNDSRWTRGKAALKPLQYMASGLPFIGSPVGVNCRFGDDGRIGLLAETPDQWLGAVERLERDETLRQSMGANGVRYVCRYHAPEVLADQLAGVFHALAGRVPSALTA